MLARLGGQNYLQFTLSTDAADSMVSFDYRCPQSNIMPKIKISNIIVTLLII